MTTGNSIEEIREEHTRAEAYDKAKLDRPKLTKKIARILYKLQPDPYAVRRGITLEGALAQILALLEPLIEEHKEKCRMSIEWEVEEAKKQERERILNQMALERGDYDVGLCFEDYYWLPKDVWRALKGG